MLGKVDFGAKDFRETVTSMEDNEGDLTRGLGESLEEDNFLNQFSNVGEPWRSAECILYRRNLIEAVKRQVALVKEEGNSQSDCGLKTDNTCMHLI